MAITITAATWAANVATFTTSAAHGITPNTQVNISGATPAGWNGTFTALAGTTGSTIVVAMPTNPGAYVSGGAVTTDLFSSYPSMRVGLIALAHDGSVWYTAKNAMTMVAPAGTVTHPDALAAVGGGPALQASTPAPAVHNDDDEPERRTTRHRR